TGDLREQIRLSRCSPQIQTQVEIGATRHRRQSQSPLQPARLYLRDRGGVASVESVCHPQNRRQSLDSATHLLIETAVIAVRLFRLGAAMIPRDIGDG